MPLSAEHTTRGRSPSSRLLFATASMVSQRSFVETLVPPNFKTIQEVFAIMATLLLKYSGSQFDGARQFKERISGAAYARERRHASRAHPSPANPRRRGRID